MIQFFENMEGPQQFYWILAVGSSLVFVIQAVMMVIGFSADTDIDLADAPDAVPESGDATFDADGFHLISIKTVVCFLLGFGWTGVLFWDAIESQLLLGLLAGAVGLVFMLLIAFLLFQVRKLDKDNTFRMEQVIGRNAEVYLRIPAQRKNSGKIIVSLNGSMHELSALTDGEELPTGTKVRITAKVDGESLLVERL